MAGLAVDVRVESGPLWLQYLTAFGTIGAATFAGVAAFMTRRAATASRGLVELERWRETRTIDELRTRHARRVVVDLNGQPVTVRGRQAYDFILSVVNAGHDPVFKVRLKAHIGDATWGPQLLGNMSPGQQIHLMARIYTDGDWSNIDGFARVRDTDDRAWIVSARGERVEDSPAGLDQWIADGHAFATREMSAHERGSINGVIDPDFDRWREQFDEDQ
jgi:hypothetical protein